MALVLIEAAIGVYAYLHKENIKETLKKPLDNWIAEYDQQANARNIIDLVQNKVSVSQRKFKYFYSESRNKVEGSNLS